MEVRIPEVRPLEVRSRVTDVGTRILEFYIVKVFPFEVRPFEVRSWFDRVAVDLHDNHATGRPAGLPERPGLTPLS